MVCFQPICSISYAVDSMVRACAQVWGGEDTAQTPLLKRCLRATFHALSEGNLTLFEALELTNEHDPMHLRQHVAKTITDPIFRQQWEMFSGMGKPEFRQYFMSTNNRILEFVASARIRNIIGQTKTTLDFSTIMEEGYILLVNLSSGGKLSDDTARVLGTLIVNDLFLKARLRDPRKARDKPFYLYIDECSLFINEDIKRILDEARKFGLHLILSHQHLSQLKQAGEAVYSSVMTNAQTKVVFGGLQPEDAKIMAELIFMGKFDLQEDKEKYRRHEVCG